MPRSTLVSEIRQLLVGERADPRVAQGVFLVPVVAELMLQLLPPSPGLDGHFAIGAVVAAVATVGSMTIGIGWLSARWTIWLPVLDIVALGTFRLSEGTAVGVAVAFPAIWLGLQFGRRGVAVTVLAVLAAYVAPTLVQLGLTAEAFSRVTQLTLMAVICSSAVAVTAELWTSQVEQTTSSARRLELAMADMIEQRRMTRTIVNSVDVGLVSIDAEGNYQSMNPRQRHFLEVAFPTGHRGVAGQTGQVFGPDGTTPLDTEGMPTTRALRGEAFRDHLIWIGSDPAARRALAVSATPYHRADGEFGGAVLAYHDITELLQASRIKDEFVASVSHELRTPLTSIIGYVDLILDDTEAVPADVRDFLVVVQRNGRRLHRLVDDLLSTALQSVTTVLDVERVELTELVARAAREAERTAAAAGLAFHLDAAVAGQGDLEVVGDAERLTQVFDNLFSNAVKYTPAGGRISCCVVREGCHTVVRVSDTGRGISVTELAEVFTKFFRSTTVLTEAIPGVGLGLAITKTIVDAHGGEITVESELGVGTTFEVRLPLAGADTAISA